MSSAINDLTRQWSSLDLLKIIFVGVVALCLIADFFLARSVVPNGDTIQSYGQLLAVRDGNLLLRHWILSSDNDYFTDLSFFVLLSFIFGKGVNLIFIVPFFVYCLFLLCCFLIVARAARGRRERYFGLFMVLFLLGLPYGPGLDLLFRSTIHTGTMALCLIAILTIDSILSNRSFKYYALVPFTVLVFAIAASDPFAEFFFLGPLLVLIVVRCWLTQKFMQAEWALFGCTILGAGIGIDFASILSHNGGFLTAQSFVPIFVPSVQALGRNAQAVLGAVQVLFTARAGTFGTMIVPAKAGILGTMIVHSCVAYDRLFAAIVCALLCFWALWRMPRQLQDGVTHLFILGSASLALADSVSGFFSLTVSGGPGFPNIAIRYAVPIYIFISLAATLETQRIFSGVHNTTYRNVIWGALTLAMFTYFGAGALAAIRAADTPSGIVSAPQAELTSWLLAHHFRYGLSDYWTSQMVLSLSQGQIKASPMIISNGKLTLYAWNSNLALWNQTQSPQFFVLSPDGGEYGITIDSIRAAFGAPQETFHVGNYTVVQFIAP